MVVMIMMMIITLRDSGEAEEADGEAAEGGEEEQAGFGSCSHIHVPLNGIIISSSSSSSSTLSCVHLYSSEAV